jgi:HemY protein
MLRLILFLAVVLLLGFAFSWFADRPGIVTLAWEGNRYETSLMVVLAGLAALVATLMASWWIISVILRSPSLMRRFYRNRRRDRGYSALSYGLIAASSGDAAKARKLARDSRKLLGDESLVQLLEAQTLLLEGNRPEARERFNRMLEADDTRLVALRGLFVEAEREGEREASHHFAAEAAKLSPSLPWANAALIRHQARNGEFEAALRTLEASRAAGTVGKPEADRKRAVLLTAQALAEEPSAPEKAAKLALQALKLAPSLVPASLAGASALARTNDFRKATRLLEDAWRLGPQREIAESYIHLRAGDSAQDRLLRARKLASMKPDHPESLFALAEAAIAAREWAEARKAIAPLIESAPTERACMVMAAIEEGEGGNKGKVRDWLARAVRAPRDPVWMADGIVSERWLPASPVSGELDAFEWKVPAARIGAPIDFEPSGDEASPASEAGPGEPDLIEAVAAEVSSEPGPGNASASTTSSGPPMASLPDDPGVDPAEPQEKEKTFRLF